MLELYNTMTRKKEIFIPRNDEQVKMFTCGPSIYGRTHLGNFRTFVWEDVLQRYLEYLGYEVDRVLNFTDVEDKAISQAEKEGVSVEELTTRMANRFYEDSRVLKIKLPDTIARSSTSVDQAVVLIQELLKRGYAYWHENRVFFDPLKFKGFGKLFRLDMSRWPKGKRRFAKDTYPGRRWNLGDFVLWHGYRVGDELFWETEIGRGRPSWNIQDPAMITKLLGFKVDICCGGIDNLYRHHDYNIAVIEALSGEEFSRYWVHGEHLLVRGRKMSKSVGNIVYPGDLMKEGYNGQEIRFYLLCGHHRKRINLTLEKLKVASQRLGAIRSAMAKLLFTEQPFSGVKMPGNGTGELIGRMIRNFEECMNDDLNTKGAFEGLFDQLSALVAMTDNVPLSSEECMGLEQSLRKMDEVLQVIFP